MKVSESVRHALDELDRGNHEPGMLHACNAVDGTAKKRYPSKGVGARFTAFLRDFYWIVGPASLPGIDVRTRFIGAGIDGHPNPDLATAVYKIHRCVHGHGDELPDGYRLMPQGDQGQARLELGKDGVLRLPQCLPYGLLFAAVLAPESADQVIGLRAYNLTLDGNRFTVDDYWGKEALVRPIVDSLERVEVLLDLAAWRDPAAIGG